jgi:enoyl-[acyl-carrier protein] reductase II
MSAVATPRLAAAVSNAGGLGLTNLTTLTPDEARSALAEMRRLTDKPFGVNMTQLFPAARQYRYRHRRAGTGYQYILWQVRLVP